MKSLDAVVLGAGIAGMTTAVCLAEAGLRVRVRASQPPEHTHSAVAGAITGGPSFADHGDPVSAPPHVRWHRETLAEFTSLAAVPATGVRVGRGRMVSLDGDATPSWAARQPGFQPCTPQEHAGFGVAFWLSLPIVDMPRYFDYLTQRLAAAGGELEIRPVASLDALAGDADLVVNCAGVHAGELAGDTSTFPVRGQHVLVENPGLDDFLWEMGGGPGAGHRPGFVGIIPHQDRVILGGTAGVGDWSTEPDQDQTEAIVSRCTAVEPRLAGARVIGVRVGLRAARPEVRLEREPRGDVTVLHNYGHGRVGVGLSWGCAREATRLALGESR